MYIDNIGLQRKYYLIIFKI